MDISIFVLVIKDFFLLILGALSAGVSSLFSMPLFNNISVGQILLAFMAFSLIFGFILQIIKSKIGDGE